MNFDQGLVAAMPSLRKRAMFLARRPHVAEDLVQATYERALSRRHLYQDRGTLLGWLMTIMLNLHVTQLRRQRYEPILLEDLPERASAPNQEHHVRFGEVVRAVEHLPPRQRDLLELVTRGYSYTEAAAKLGLTRGAAASRLSHARVALRSAS